MVSGVVDNLSLNVKQGINSLTAAFGNISLPTVNHIMNIDKVLEIKDLKTPQENINVRARLSSIRDMKKMSFVILRDENHQTLQSIALKSSGLLDFISKDLTPESIVIASGDLIKSQNPILSCTINDMELVLKRIYCASKYNDPSPRSTLAEQDDSGIKYQDLIAPEHVPNSLAPALLKRLNRRILDLRTPHNNAIFKSVSLISNYMRQYLLQNDFLEIYTPKLISSASEGGADVFKVKYYNRDAYLAQSPQLYKQMAICGDLRRVMTVAPVFRAENSNTHRHMSEFTGFDFEMTIVHHYHEVLHMVDGVLRSAFDNFFEKHQNLIKLIESHFGPVPEFKYPSPTRIFHYREAIQMLRESGIEIGDFDDINTTNEKLLGKIIKEKYDTDYYMIDKFPLKNRAFYTLEDTDEPGSGYSNSYDVFLRGEEIISGAQRMSNADDLREKIKEMNLCYEDLQDYVEGLDQGVCPHGGAGFGLERVVMFLLGLKNIRNVSMFPRDPSRLEP
ncbi:MAG: hypothetical protein MHMPM18_000586 [Marteilia pararefringens]